MRLNIELNSRNIKFLLCITLYTKLQFTAGWHLKSFRVDTSSQSGWFRVGWNFWQSVESTFNHIGFCRGVSKEFHCSRRLQSESPRRNVYKIIQYGVASNSKLYWFADAFGLRWSWRPLNRTLYNTCNGAPTSTKDVTRQLHFEWIEKIIFDNDGSNSAQTWSKSLEIWNKSSSTVAKILLKSQMNWWRVLATGCICFVNWQKS